MSSGNVRNEVQEKDEAKEREKKRKRGEYQYRFLERYNGFPKADSMLALFLKIYWRMCWRFITKYIAVNHRCVNN